MSSETNKLLCAVLTAILFFLLSSFIGELVYHYDKKVDKLSYTILEDTAEDSKKIILEDKKIIISKEKIDEMLIVADIKEGQKFAKKNCGTCHKFDLPETNKIGPSLALIFNKQIASAADYKYSSALREKAGLWNTVNLYLFLESPKKWVPGTKMSYKGIKKEQDIINLIKYVSLNTYNNAN